MKIKLIVAVAENGVIGNDLDIPWNIPSDFKRFKKLTKGTGNNAIIMGHTTFKTLNGGLPGRVNIVISRQEGLFYPNALVVNSYEQAIRAAEMTSASEAWIIGGSNIYRDMAEYCESMEVTLIHERVTGNVVFHQHSDIETWKEIKREGPFKENGYSYSYVTYRKRNEFVIYKSN